jgi:hypothetical protein
MHLAYEVRKQLYPNQDTGKSSVRRNPGFSIRFDLACPRIIRDNSIQM